MYVRSIWIKLSIVYQWKEKSRNWLLKNSKAFIDYSQKINDIYEKLEDYIPANKIKISIVVDDMTAGMKTNRKWSPIISILLNQNIRF